VPRKCLEYPLSTPVSTPGVPLEYPCEYPSRTVRVPLESARGLSLVAGLTCRRAESRLRPSPA
jgi:hypothetical protein